MEANVIIAWVLVVFLFLFIIFLIAWNTISRANLVLPENCGAKGEIGVVTNKQIKILNTCGTSKNEPCIFTNVPSLQDAIGRCQINSCLAFTYSESTKQMTIVNNDLTESGPYNVYLNSV